MLGRSSVTVKFAVLADSSTVKSLIDTTGVPEGASLSMIAAFATVFPIKALVALDRFRRNVSIGSAAALLIRVTGMVSVVCPGAKLSVPDVAT